MINAVNEFLDDLRGGKMTEAPIVTVEQGQLQGRVVPSPGGKPFYSFQGIPYAKPPLGSLRFKAPQPPEPWEGIRDATSEGNVCAQIEPFVLKDYLGDENCLFLNIYTPNLDGQFLPVMVFIHGGGFKFGSGNSNFYGCDYLVEKDVVVVTLNYRCGALGFLGLNTPEVPGNAGLKDMVQAIRWVKENIQNFGGNPGNVTIFGESAGAVSVSILTASPLTKNLINKAIIQSGTALSSWSYQKNPIENARALAQTLGCDSTDPDEILEFLTATPAREVVEAQEKLTPKYGLLERSPKIFGYVVEKEFPGVEALLSEAFIDLVTSGRTSDIPIMIGSNTLEFALDMIVDDLQDLIPKDFNLEKDSPDSLAIANKIKRIYFNGKPHAVPESLINYYELVSDTMINVDTHRYVQYLVQVTNRPIYYYKFDYVGELNVSKKFEYSQGLKFPMHMDELGYIFKNDFQEGLELSAQDSKMRERMLRLWTNFAKDGNPTPDESHLLPVTWLPVTKDNLYYLNLGSELTLQSNPDQEKMEFWDSLYNKHFRIWEHPKTNAEEVLVRVPVIDQEPTPIEPEPTHIEPEPSHIEPVPTHIEPEPTHIELEPETIVETTIISEEIPPVPETPDNSPEITETEPITIISEVEQSEPIISNGFERKSRPSNEIKMIQQSNGTPRDVIRANDPPEDDLPKNIGVNKFVNFFESLGGKK